MKKTYLMPAMRELNMIEEEMIAASVDGFSGTLDNDNTITDETSILGRESIWDDED